MVTPLMITAEVIKAVAHKANWTLAETVNVHTTDYQHIIGLKDFNSDKGYVNVRLTQFGVASNVVDVICLKHDIDVDITDPAMVDQLIAFLKMLHKP